MFGHARMAFRVTAYVGFVEDGLLPGHADTRWVDPRKVLVDHLALLYERRAVAFVEREVVAVRVQGVAEHRGVPFQLAHVRLGVRVEQQLVRIESMPVLRLVRTMHAIPIDRARLQTEQVDVENFIGVFRQFDVLEFLFAAVIEEAQLDFRGVRGEQGEVDALAVPGRAQGQRRAFGNAVIVCHVLGCPIVGCLNRCHTINNRSPAGKPSCTQTATHPRIHLYSCLSRPWASPWGVAYLAVPFATRSPASRTPPGSPKTTALTPLPPCSPTTPAGR